MFSRDNLFFGGVFLISIVGFIFWGFDYLENNHLLFLIAASFGLFMAFNIGGNDVANSFGTSVGAKTLTIKQALMIAAVFELSGAMLAGAEVTDTIKKGIIDVTAMTFDPMLLVFVMMGALLASALWLLYATFKGLPVSTTHSIVGGVLGGGIALGYVTMPEGSSVMGLIHWEQIGTIVLSWIISPILGGLASYGIYWYLKKNILDYNENVEKEIHDLKILKKDYNETTASEEQKSKHQEYVEKVAFLKKKNHAFYALRTHAPLIAAFAVTTIVGTLLFKGLKHTGIKLDGIEAILLMATFATLAYGATFAIVKEMHKDTPKKATIRLFSMLQVLTASAFAFSHGANDIANAIGPFAAIIDILSTGNISPKAAVPTPVMITFGVALVAGLWFLGKEVINTIGHRIAEIFPVTGFSAELGATLVILVATKMGIPVSSTHILVGAVIGIGMLNKNANWALMKPIAMSWIITLPASMILSVVTFFILKFSFGY